MQEVIVSNNLGKENEQADGINKTVKKQFEISNHKVSDSSEIVDRQSGTIHKKAPQPRLTGRESNDAVIRRSTRPKNLKSVKFDDFLWKN